MKTKKGDHSNASPEEMLAESLKELGNVAFAAGNYLQSIECYTSAIFAALKVSPDTRPNHIYFSNRANAKL